MMFDELGTIEWILIVLILMLIFGLNHIQTIKRFFSGSSKDQEQK
jgi:Sec-independent protein translocase protein TatA